MIMLGEEPPYLPVGTEVSAKYKGAFCEAKVRKVDRVVKCKVAFKQGYGSHTVLDNQIKGLLRIGSHVEARHPEKKEIVEGTITKIQDCSQYTVVFDDGDITTLRRSALCLKSGRHFAESETLDQLPLTHPEHFGNPVVGRRGGRRRLGSEDSSEEEEEPKKGKPIAEREAEIGKVVCVEINDKKKAKDNWFPGLVVAPNATDTVRIRVKEEFLVRSFKDARYYTVPKKEATEFTREIGLKVENNTLKAAVEKALTFLDKDELPPHWDSEQLFSVANTDDSDSDGGLDSDSSDDEPREEKDHFVAQLYKFMDDRGTPINVCPSVCSRDLDLYKLFKIVNKMNGYNRVSNHNQWKLVSVKLGLGTTPQAANQVKHAYKRYLHSFEDLNRKLGCTMVNHPRSGRSRSRTGRSLIRDKDRSTPVKMEPVATVSAKKEDDSLQESNSEPKKIVPKDEEPKPKLKCVEVKKEKEDEKEADEPSDSEPTRPLSNLRKKFPTLKASPRTKEDAPALKRRAETRSESKALTRPKRVLRENSIDDGRTSGEESTKTSQGSDEQRSTTRAKTKQLEKKDADDNKKAKSSKSSDSDGSKKGKVVPEEVKKNVEAIKGKRPANEEPPTKRNGKRRNTETEETLARPCLAANKSIFVGDVLKVYYGSSKDSNCIYEAKVIEEGQNNGETMYRVHYAGWNSRYDEWIQRDRIADNLSWTARRTKTPVTKSAKVSSNNSKKKSTGGKGEPARSTTPSSITSSSSRTKSPATPVGARRRIIRRDRPASAGITHLRRTRRISGHTEVSVDSQSESDSESEESESETLIQAESPIAEPKKQDTTPVTKKLGMRRRPAKKPLAEPLPEVVEKKKPRLVKAGTKNEKDASKSSDTSNTPTKQSGLEVKEEIEDADDGGDDEVVAEGSPKGRDFDLNEIRSELKGIVKVNTENSPGPSSEPISEDPEELPPALEAEATGDDEMEPLVEAPTLKEEPTEAGAKPIEEQEEVKIEPEVVEEVPSPSQPPPLEELETPASAEDVKEDVYEFKEPEPFDFQEVRRPIRIFDEIERSPEKQIVKTVVPIPTPLRATFEKTGPSAQEELKSRFKNAIGKKLKEDEEKSIMEVEKTEDEESLIKEAPHLEVEVFQPPPLLMEATVVDVPAPQLEEPEKVPSVSHKQSPEPPCLLPVTETEPAEPCSLLSREEPPRLTMETSSSDSEGEERLVIDNEDSTSNDAKVETNSLPPVLGVEDRREVKRSPLAEIRLKRSEDRFKSVIPNNELPKEQVPAKPSTSCLRQDKPPAEPEGLSGIRSLVCDEVIPGSPGPKDQPDELPFQAPPASVIENTPPTTPPTTPESNVSSPREDRVGRIYQSMELSSLDNESSKSHRDSSEDIETLGLRNRGLKFEKRHGREPMDSPPKKKRNRRRCESASEGSKRLSGRSVRREAHDSESDDTSENSQTVLHVTDPLANSRSPKPSKYNFCKEMAPDMDSNQRIAFLQHQLQELRKAYVNVKSQLASIDRRRKKLRRKDREEKLAGVAAAQAALSAKTQEVTPQ